MGIRREEEMEMSDEDLEENPCKKVRMDNSGMSFALQTVIKIVSNVYLSSINNSWFVMIQSIFLWGLYIIKFNHEDNTISVLYLNTFKVDRSIKS